MPAKSNKSSKGNSQPTNGKGKAVPIATSSSAPFVQDDAEVNIVTIAGGQPDKAGYYAEQEAIKAEIDAVHAKVAAVKQKISLASKNGGNDRRAALHAELDTLRAKQSSAKNSRTELLEQLHTIQGHIQKKVKDLQAAKAKAPFKSVAEIDAQIKHLEKQVESGRLRLVDETRALSEISSLKRSRKTVKAFQDDQDAAIAAERARAYELRSQLNDPETKALSQRFTAIKRELYELKKESDEAFAGRNKLYHERHTLSAELNALYEMKRESSRRFREISDMYWRKVNEERARRVERIKAQGTAGEEKKRRQAAEALLKRAKVPAFQLKIEDCQTLIDYFTKLAGRSAASVPAPTTLSTSAKTDVIGVPKLVLRQVEQQPVEGLIARKKKGEDEESYFVGGKGKAKKGNNKSGASSTPARASGALNMPLATLTTLLKLSIPPPSSIADLPRAIEDLKTKKLWLEANQDKVTAANIAKAEARVKCLGA